MGYHTEFYGSFLLNKKLTKNHADYLNMFADTRRMKRDTSVIPTMEKVNKKCLTLLKKVKLPLGNDGEYYCGTGLCGQDQDISIVEYNIPPSSQPGLWCKWVPSDDGKEIVWNGLEKFYDYIEWIKYLIDHFIKPWGYTLNGTVEWQGEERDDRGIICINDNRVTTKTAKVTWE